jgi:dihydroorotate dehydrogenase (fumarate)
MGLKLASPLIASSNPLNLDIENLASLERFGVGAAILPSLFEEQIDVEDVYETYKRHYYGNAIPKPLEHLTSMQGYNKGSAGYLSLIFLAKQVVQMPIIASLNGVSTEGWIRYARLLEGAGADALELNTYFIPTYTYHTSQSVEDMYIRLVEAVRASTKLPLAVKINPYITALPAFVKRLEEAGADAVVMFNRFYQPDIDPVTETVVSNLELSTMSELRLRLRWAALIRGQVTTDLGITGGIQSGQDLVKSILAGGTVGMVASAFLRSGVAYAGDILDEFGQWMDTHGYATVDAFRGKLSPRPGEKATAFVRANYIKELRSYAEKNEIV